MIAVLMQRFCQWDPQLADQRRTDQNERPEIHRPVDLSYKKERVVNQLERKLFLADIKKKAVLLPGIDVERGVTTVLRLLADNLSAAATRSLAKEMPEEWQADIGRAIEKVDHDNEEFLQLVANQADLEPDTARQIAIATFRSLWEGLPDEQVESISRQVPARLAMTLRGTRPGDKRLLSQG